MYRTYRDPHLMEKYLEEAKERLEDFKAHHSLVDNDDYDMYIDLVNDVAYYEEQVNFAWQDDEAAEMGWD